MNESIEILIKQMDEIEALRKQNADTRAKVEVLEKKFDIIQQRLELIDKLLNKTISALYDHQKPAS